MNLIKSLIWLTSLVGVTSYTNGVDTWENPNHGSWASATALTSTFPLHFRPTNISNRHLTTLKN